MKKINIKDINREEFIEYYSSHTRKETAEKYKISEATVKRISKKFNFKKSLEMIGQSVSKFYENNKLIAVHIPGKTSFIKVYEDEVQKYLDKGYVLGYELSSEMKDQKNAKIKQTKLKRYGDENYNNLEKGKKTNLELYGDENYNNKEKIKETQFNLYGGFAFNDWDKVKKTNLERYGVEHIWSSHDHDGHQKRYDMYGGKENYYKHVMEKGKATRLELYGDEFYSNTEKAQKTMLEKYGYTSYMLTEDFRRASESKETSDKVLETKKKNHTFTKSEPEDVVENILRKYFGNDDIVRSYNDPRYSRESDGYQFNCDFYIKSKDLFIELNLHPTHCLKPFEGDTSDLSLLEKLKNNPTQWNKTCVDVWSVRDVQKREVAIKNKLNYITIYPDRDYNDIIDIIEEEGY